MSHEHGCNKCNVSTLLPWAPFTNVCPKCRGLVTLTRLPQNLTGEAYEPTYNSFGQLRGVRDYYVYVYLAWGHIQYVGYGCGARWNSRHLKKSRPKVDADCWVVKRLADEGGAHEARFIRHGMTHEDALLLERYCISYAAHYGVFLTNVKTGGPCDFTKCTARGIQYLPDFFVISG